MTGFKAILGPLLSTVPSGAMPIADAFPAVRRQRHLRRQMDEGGSRKIPKRTFQRAAPPTGAARDGPT